MGGTLLPVLVCALVLPAGAHALMFVPSPGGILPSQGEPVLDEASRVVDRVEQDLADRERNESEIDLGPVRVELCVGTGLNAVLGCPPGVHIPDPDGAGLSGGGPVEPARVLDVSDAGGSSIRSTPATGARSVPDRPAVDASPVPAQERPDPIPWTFAAVALASTFGLLVLFRRLAKDELLEDDLRASIVELVRDRPGLDASTLAEELDVTTNTVLYHVRLMAEFGLLSLDESGRAVLCFVGDEDRRERRLRKLARSQAKQELLELVRDRPGINVSQAAERLGKAPSTVAYHVDGLVEAGWLARTRAGRSVELWVSDDAGSTADRSTA